jgi:hypothetical protein
VGSTSGPFSSPVEASNLRGFPGSAGLWPAPEAGETPALPGAYTAGSQKLNDPALPQSVLDQFSGSGRASLAKNFSAGNRVELECITVVVVRLAREAGVPVPINATLYAILKPWAVGIAAQQGQST